MIELRGIEDKEVIEGVIPTMTVEDVPLELV